MAYLYHKKPKKVLGNILHPLNILKKEHPKIYNEEVKKYQNTPAALEGKVAPLNCLFNDVLHLSPINPLKIKVEVEKLGGMFEPVEFYKIDPHILEKDLTTIWLYSDTELLHKPYDPDNIESLNRIFQETLTCYQNRIENNEPLRLWQKTPHILYKGSIRLENLEVMKI